MQPIHFVAIIVRLFAVGLFIFSIERVAMLLVPTPMGAEFFLYYIAAFSGLFGAILLWVFPTLVSKKLVPLEPNSLSHDKLSLNDWYRLAFITLGLFLLFNSISELFFWLTYLLYSNDPYQSYDITKKDQASIVATVFEFALSLIFILSSKRIISLIRATKTKT